MDDMPALEKRLIEYTPIYITHLFTLFIMKTKVVHSKTNHICLSF